MSHNGSLNDGNSSNESLRLPRSRAQADAQYLRIPRLPAEWYQTNSWRLPSGKALAEFALQSGFLAPLLFKTEGVSSTGLAGLGFESTHRSRSLKKAEHA